tara:strand:+ start:432 stop:812 length:381 start_codon:yes stop_codon:yes gene_type:complete
VSVPPGATEVGPVFVMERSAVLVQFTVVVMVALVLLPLLGSVDELDTVTWFEMVDPHVAVLGTLKEMVTVLAEPFTREMLLHRIFAPFCIQFTEDPPLLYVSPDGMGSLMVTPSAVSGPAFVTVAV